MSRPVLFLCLVLGSAVACDSLPGRPDPAGRYQRPADVEDFQVLYATNCSGCHGEDGRNGPATNLGDPLYAALAKPAHVRRTVAEGVAGTPMPVFAIEGGGTLTEKQIGILTHGLKTHGSAGDEAALVRGAPPLVASRGSGVSDSPGQAGRGAQAYRDFCSRCHGDDGAGGERAGSIVEPAYLGLVSDQGLRTTVIVGREDLGMPGWRSAGDRPMTAKEVGDVVAWLASQRLSVRDRARPETDD